MTIVRRKFVRERFRFARVTIAIVPGGDGLHGERISQIERHERHVHGVASHIAERTSAEIPPAAPIEGMITFSKRTIRDRTQIQIPMHLLGRRFGFRPSDALRPDGAIGPDVNFFHRAKHAGANHGRRATQIAVRRVLVSHLRGDFLLRGNFAEPTSFP